MEVDVSPEMLGRTFNGIGEPIDGLGPITAADRRDINGLPLNPSKERVSEKLYPYRHFSN